MYTGQVHEGNLVAAYTCSNDYLFWYHWLYACMCSKYSIFFFQDNISTSLPTPQDKLVELELQHLNLQELLEVLREQSTGKGSSGVAGKLMEWHAKLGEVRMKEMRVTRDNER